MSEHKQITNLDDVVGKTITRATYLIYTDAIGIVFADGSYLHLVAETDCGGGSTIATIRTPVLGYKIMLGIASEREIEIKRQFDEAAERDRKETRRLEYEKLRAEFEGTST